MKKRLPLFLLLVCGFAYAQQHIDTGVASQTNTIFSLLEKKIALFCRQGEEWIER